MKLLILKKIYSQIVSVLLPQRCLVCGKEGANLCARCREKIPLLGQFSHDGVFSLWEYGHPNVRNALLALKYKNKRTIAADIAESLYDVLFEQLTEKSLFNTPLSSSFYAIVPIPISAQRFKKRGYNQAELLAKELSRQNQAFFTLETEVLYKVKDTKTQVSVRNREKRLQNIRGSFAAKNTHRIEGKTVILIDDITTTGATLQEARHTLLKAGAKVVYNVAIAH